VLAGCQGRSLLHGMARQRFVRGQLLAESGDNERALAELQRAVAMEPNLSVAHTAIGDIHRRQGDYQQARSSYQKACLSDPYAFRPHYNLGVTYQELSRSAEKYTQAQEFLIYAVQVYLRAAAIEPQDFDTNLNLSACYYELQKISLAEQHCRRAVELRPDSRYAHSNLGTICQKQGRLEEAIRAYKKSLELDTSQTEVVLKLASAYFQQGRVELALDYYAFAADQDPSLSEPWERIGACCYHLGKIERARDAFEKALKRDPRSADAHRGLGVIHMRGYLHDRSRTDLRDRALECWRASLRCRPGQPRLRELLEKYAPEPIATGEPSGRGYEASRGDG
jgi:tetratricopeptide (TPR) repeat protein